ncbi:MAG: protein kinase domain-containing protein [Gemmatimonadaceae bacterium]
MTIEELSAALADRYRVERQLGAGGMASVYLAHDVKHDREVALKMLHPELADVLGAERFLKEIRISARLDHPHILTLIDSGVAAGTLYYVLPYVRGESLRARLDRERELPLEEALAITRQVASALEYAHKQGVVHRDIKPENILIHEGEAVVADFGIALALLEAGGERLTQPGLSLGTPQYMSPEQATGDRAVDARSDVYSLGAVLYEMLTGEAPHSGPTTQSVVAKMLTERPTAVRVLREGVPAEIDAAVLKALAKTPADRFATAQAFASALSPSRTGDTQAYESPRVGRRTRVLAAGGAIVIALVAVLAVTRRFVPGADKNADTWDPRHVAVLYFRSAESDTLRRVADGLTEGLIGSLARVSTLRVVSPNGVAPFRQTAVTADSIGRALGVGSLIEGSVTKVGTTLRVNVSLVDAARGSVLGSATFDRPLDDVLAIQDSAVASAAEFLRQRLGEQITLREERQRTRSAEAWQLVQQARALARSTASLLQTGDTSAARRELARADSLLAHASELDGQWVTPFVGRARLADQGLDLSNFDPKHYDEWTRRGLEHVTAALVRQPDNAEALGLRGRFRYLRSVVNIGASPQAVAALGDSAEADLRAAVASDANQAEAWALLSHRLMRKSEIAEGKLAALRAYEADPYAKNTATILWRLYAASLDLEDRTEAMRWCEEGKHRFPDMAGFIECQITVQALPGQKPDVPTMWRLLDRNVQLYPPPLREYRRRRGQLLVAMTLVRAGLVDSARRVAERSHADATVDPSRDLVYVEMLLRNILGDRDEALRLAATYYAANPQERTPCGTVDRTWWMRGLADDPRYQAVSCMRR